MLDPDSIRIQHHIEQDLSLKFSTCKSGLLHVHLTRLQKPSTFHSFRVYFVSVNNRPTYKYVTMQTTYQDMLLDVDA